jgi:hypothetical protein
MGKKTIRAQTRTLERIPVPNQITSKGAMATVGTDWEATMNGASTRSAMGE